MMDASKMDASNDLLISGELQDNSAVALALAVYMLVVCIQ